MVCQKRGVTISEAEYAELVSLIPLFLTPSAAETLAVKIYRLVGTSNATAADSLRRSLMDYQNPVPLDPIEFQIRLAVSEASISNSFRTGSGHSAVDSAVMLRRWPRKRCIRRETPVDTWRRNRQPLIENRRETSPPSLHHRASLLEPCLSGTALPVCLGSKLSQSHMRRKC